MRIAIGDIRRIGNDQVKAFSSEGAVPVTVPKVDLYTMTLRIGTGQVQGVNGNIHCRDRRR